MSFHRRLRRRSAFTLLFAAAILPARLAGHPITFNSVVSYSPGQPSGGASGLANWTGAIFDAGNIGGSGINADGGANNGAANNSSTYVANNQPIQGQTFTTGPNPNGYHLTAVTARMAGYSNNTASGTNRVSWDLNAQNGPVAIEIGKVSGTTFSTVAKQNFIMGGAGSPGSGVSTNGAGTYITFNLPFTTHLQPNTTYAFDFWVGNGSANFFEWLGTSADPYSGGTAYSRSGGTITPLTGDRVFQLDMTALAAPSPAFVHPGTLHTQADLDRMKAKVAAGAEPWKSSYDILAASPWAQTWWPAYDVDYIVRGDSGNNYTRSQQDAQAIYELALRWHITGDSAYADKAVQIANVWSGLQGVTGNSNLSLAAGICGHLFAVGGELLSTYPGWPAAEKQAYKDMMMRVFYQANLDFLWRHHDTPFTKGGNTHYRLNWDTCNMASMMAIGILCDNRAVYQQAVDFFKNGPGNGRIERAAWYIHPDGTAQGEETGRDQGHNIGGWEDMASLCQAAWNQGDDLYGYDNNRVLRGLENVAKFNLGNDVAAFPHRNASLTYTEGGVSGAGRGNFVPMYEMVYNHYVNVKGMAAPYSKQAADRMRPEDRPHTEYHPSQVDWFGLGSLTFTRDPIATSVPPSGLTAHWSKNRILLHWFGSAHATSYQIKRATAAGGPYTTIGTVNSQDLVFTDSSVSNGSTYHYLVTAVTPSGDLDSAPLAISQKEVTRYAFDGNANDAIGVRHAVLKGGSTGLPAYTTGKTGQAIGFDGVDDFVQLPTGTGNYQDITISAWVWWNGGANWQRIFDFGSEIEKYMMLTPKSASNTLRFQMTTTRGTDATLTLDGPAMPTNSWTHVAVTLNGDTATLYVNGVPVDSDTTGFDPLFGQPFCYLGKSMWNTDPLFSGRIDDFRIHNHALSGSDIYSLWGQSVNSPPVFGTDPIDKTSATEDFGYTGESLAGNATDANGGTLVFSKVSGPEWLVVAANGTLSGMPTNGDIGPNTFLVRVADSSGATDDATLRITVSNTNDAPVWNSSSISKPSVTRGQPYLAVSLAADASDADAGGMLTFSKTSGPAWLSVAADGTLSGTPAAGDVGGNSFVVRVTDNVGAYSEATLDITVLSYQLRSHHAFEDNTDDSLGNFPGTASGSPAYGTGRIGRGLVFDGVDDFVSLPQAAADCQDISVAAWVSWNGGAANQRVFDFGNDTSHYLFLSPDSGGLRFAIKDGGAEQSVTSTALASGRWVHLTVTLGGNMATLYVNGAVAGTNSAVSIKPGDFKPKFNYIGKSQWPDPLFNGMIDGFRMYNHAITPAEIAVLMDEVPAVPVGVTATPKTSRIDLSWAVSQGAQSYNVKRSLTSGGPYTVVASGLTGTTFSDSGLTNGVPHHYVVSATNTKGESADSAQVTAVPSDLLAWLKFDETTGTTAADSSGNGWNATLVNAPAWTPGVSNGCVSLPATAQQALTLPAGIVGGLSDFTFSGWVKVGAFSTFSRIFDFGTGTNNYLFLTPQYTATAPNAAKFRFAIRTPTVGEQQLNSSTAVAAGTWVHYAVTLSGNTGRMYLNGALVATNTGMTLRPSSLGSTTLNFLGDSQFAADPIFNGQLDEFRIHSRALTAGEVLAAAMPLPEVPTFLNALAGDATVALGWTASNSATTYNVKRATAIGGPYSTVGSGITSTTFTDTGMANDITCFYLVTATNAQGESAGSNIAAATPNYLRVHLRFDESGGTTAADATGHGWNGSLVNSPASEAGKIGNALNFTGASSQHATLPAGVVNGLTDITLMTWVKTGTLSTWQRVFDFGTGTTNYLYLTTQYAAGGNANKLRFAITTSGNGGEQGINSSTLTPAGTWAHVAVVLGGGTGTLYLNGVEVGRNTAMTLTPSSLGSTTQNYLGRSQWPDPYLNASLDDFRIYSRALSTGEIAALIQPPSVPSGLNAEAVAPSRIDLSWAASPGAAGYQVKRSTTADGTFSPVTGVESISYNDSGVTNGTTYYYVVSAVNALGESSDSDPVSATPLSLYQRWKQDHGLPLSMDAAATPDGDGIPVLMKYATGLTPGTPAANPVALTGASPALTIRFNRLSPAEVDYVVESSTDCSVWSPVATLAAGSAAWTGSAGVSETGAGPLRAATVVDPLPVAIDSRRFLRLRVVLVRP